MFTWLVPDWRQPQNSKDHRYRQGLYRNGAYQHGVAFFALIDSSVLKTTVDRKPWPLDLVKLTSDFTDAELGNLVIRRRAA